ncbi:hypothetical protein [Qaidamihabitans albus]|uniref:hypothetical protein n=1 Tax=Qaidamihabitans albus TaxID=2795733 RepID=UPI0018F2215D|nr:hypothetical protein [Qaidamihabitans albus]
MDAALSLAVRAPSMRNPAPWRWTVDGPVVHLHTAPGQDGSDTGCRDVLPA